MFTSIIDFLRRVFGLSPRTFSNVAPVTPEKPEMDEDLLNPILEGGADESVPPERPLTPEEPDQPDEPRIPEPPTLPDYYKKTLIFILAGHGGSDPGAVANNVKERDLANEQQGKVVAELKAKGYQMVLTEDPSIRLVETINFVKTELTKTEHTISLLVDLHFNAATPAAAGTEVFHKTEASDEEKRLAADLSKRIATGLETNDRGAKPESWSQHSRLGILHTDADTSVLIETAFITNAPELQKYLSKKSEVAKAIADAIDNFLRNNNV